MIRMSRPTLEEGLRAVESIMAKYVEHGWKSKHACGAVITVLDETEQRWFPFFLGGMRTALLEELIELERKEKTDGKDGG